MSPSVMSREEAVMRTVLATLALCLVPGEASAIVRYFVQGMTCSQVQEVLQRDGAAILYSQGSRGVTLYDRFVGEAAICASGTVAVAERVAVADREDCRVLKCIQAERMSQRD
jgi:hypothetical protein